LVKTVNFKEPKYVGDPINAVKIFNEKEVDELVFLDVMATPESRKPDFELISKITTECFMPFAYGGGINSIETIKTLFTLGVEKVVLNTAALETPSLVKDASAIFGSQSIVVSIDAKKDLLGRSRLFIRSGTKSTGIDPVQFAIQIEKAGAGEIFLNSIDHDGCMDGYDLDLIRNVSEAVKIPVIACGGAGKLDDFREAICFGASAVAAGSFFVFYGPHKAVLINYPSPKELREL
ncbi:MAG: imidazole glycerol phosphate synthase subunit HisF, partial [Candidatus Aenigmarchaeota archaeon]|nr:imidazole glycerol phosphate synthase subunit HisF [Candidatus Aenigmarchaeota archaeon]